MSLDCPVSSVQTPDSRVSTLDTVPSAVTTDIGYQINCGCIVCKVSSATVILAIVPHSRSTYCPRGLFTHCYRDALRRHRVTLSAPSGSVSVRSSLQSCCICDQFPVHAVVVAMVSCRICAGTEYPWCALACKLLYTHAADVDNPSIPRLLIILPLYI